MLHVMPAGMNETLVCAVDDASNLQLIMYLVSFVSL